MTGLLDAAALLVTAAALGAAMVALASTRRPRAALSVLLDLLTAAGLLRLAAEPQWHRLLSAAAVVGLRHMIVLGVGVQGFQRQSRSTLAVPPDVRAGPPSEGR